MEAWCCGDGSREFGQRCRLLESGCYHCHVDYVVQSSSHSDGLAGREQWQIGADDQLLISGHSKDSGGGVFLSDGTHCEGLDSLGTTGLAVSETHVARALWPTDTKSGGGEILVYDHRGVLRYLRIDELGSTHDLLWDGPTLLAVSSGTNSVLWINQAGTVTHRWHAGGTGDAWHLNTLLRAHGRLVLSAFGRFDFERDWAQHKDMGCGIAFDLASGETLLNGLDRPHNPRPFGDEWLICNSGRGELLHLAADGVTVRRRLMLHGWTRGLAIRGETAFVGVSEYRGRSVPGTLAYVAVVDLASWMVSGRIEVPCRSIYDVVGVPAHLVGGLRAGFRTNRQRSAEDDRLALFREAGVAPLRLWATGEPLPRNAMHVRLNCDLPDRMRPGEVLQVTCTLTNHAGVILVAAPPHPVHLAYRWFDQENNAMIPGGDGERTPIASLPPGVAHTEQVRVTAPPHAGQYGLRVSLVQEHVAWFDDIAPENGAIGHVVVSAE